MGNSCKHKRKDFDQGEMQIDRDEENDEHYQIDNYALYINKGANQWHFIGALKDWICRRPPLIRPVGSNKNSTKGLANIRNSCYMNSALQCLFATPLILESINTGLDSLHFKGNLATIFRIIMEARTKTSISKSELKDLKMCVSKYNERFEKYSQEDIAEFLSTLISGIGKSNLGV